MNRWLFFVYGVGCHLIFLVTLAYMVAFVGNIFVPKSIDSSAEGPIGTAVVINLSLLGLFAAQHSIMARPAFKQVWTRVIPKPIERSTYVLISCLVTVLVMLQWRTIGSVVWELKHPVLRSAMWALFAAGWLLVPLVSLMIDHFDLFGTRQVWFYLRRREYKSLPFRTPMAYRHVRHPLYIGWAIAFWATPKMTVGHLLFAGVLTGYMGLAVIIEERDLVAVFGQQYQDYRRRVPMFLPQWRTTVNDCQPSTDTSTVNDKTDLEACRA